MRGVAGHVRDLRVGDSFKWDCPNSILKKVVSIEPRTTLPENWVDYDDNPSNWVFVIYDTEWDNRLGSLVHIDTRIRRYGGQE